MAMFGRGLSGPVKYRIAMNAMMTARSARSFRAAPGRRVGGVGSVGGAGVCVVVIDPPTDVNERDYHDGGNFVTGFAFSYRPRGTSCPRGRERAAGRLRIWVCAP